MNYKEAKETSNTDYRIWLYSKINGVVQSVIYNVKEAEEKLKEGWVMSPAKFAAPELQVNADFQLAANGTQNDLNFLLNLDNVKDKDILEEFTKNMFDVDLDKRKSIKNLIEEVKILSEKLMPISEGLGSLGVDENEKVVN
jgi:hypothetical protein